MPSVRISPATLALAAFTLLLTSLGCASLGGRGADALEARADAIAREVGSLEAALPPQPGSAASLYLDFADEFGDAADGYRFLTVD